MKSARLDKEKIIKENLIKHVRHLFKLKEQINDNIIKVKRHLFRPK